MTNPALLSFVLVVVLAFTVQTAIGFASGILCVTLGAHFLPIPEVVALMLPLSFAQTSYILARHHEGIRWRLLIEKVLPAMGLGAVIGYVGIRALAGEWMRSVYAVLVCLLAARELWRLQRSAAVEGRLSPWASRLTIFFGGIVHGVYATGGPLVAYAIGREGLTKRELRSTMSVIWVVMNAALIVTLALDGQYPLSFVPKLAAVFLALPVAVVLGEIVHHRVDERRFAKALFALLLVAGLTLFFH